MIFGNNFKFKKAIINPKSSFGGWSIERDFYNFIRANLPDNSILLELGSGAATDILAKNYKMFSVEHDHRFINKYKSTYIYAPIVGNWYDRNCVSGRIPANYDSILIDGPPGDISNNRIGFFNNIDLFNTDVMLMFDDTNRAGERRLFDMVLEQLSPREFEHYKTFSIIYKK